MTRSSIAFKARVLFQQHPFIMLCYCMVSIPVPKSLQAFHLTAKLIPERLPVFTQLHLHHWRYSVAKEMKIWESLEVLREPLQELWTLIEQVKFGGSGSLNSAAGHLISNNTWVSKQQSVTSRAGTML